MPPTNPPPLPPKSILVFCDGTGQDGLIAVKQKPTQERQKDKSKKDEGEENYFTNVLRLSRAIEPAYWDPETEDSRIQIVYYQSGVEVPTNFEGKDSDLNLAKAWGKALGTAVASKIRDAYNFIAQNYQAGDRICIFGFSRGAYTARKVAGLIHKIGLLEPQDMGNFFAYWKYLNNLKGGIEPPEPTRKADIDCVGTWDTVGSVRAPGSWGWPKEVVDALSIKDNQLPPNVKLALHALAFHENREPFMATLYAGKNTESLKQVWFPGAHSDVGGGYADQELADISLAWMVGEIESIVKVKKDFIQDCMSANRPKIHWGQSKPKNANLVADWRLPEEHRTKLIDRSSALHPSLRKSPTVEGLLKVSEVEKYLQGPLNWDVKLNPFEIQVQNNWGEVGRGVNGPVFEGHNELDDIF